jgi:hypothetical protein
MTAAALHDALDITLQEPPPESQREMRLGEVLKWNDREMLSSGIGGSPVREEWMARAQTTRGIAT